MGDQSKLLSFDAVVSKVKFSKDGFAIFETEGDLLNPAYAVKGEVRSIKAGMRVSIVGELVRDQRYGDQIKATSIFPTMMKRDTRADGSFVFNAEDLISYMGSGILPGVGEVKARRIVEKFGPDTEMVLRTDPMKLATVPGISEKSAMAICDQWIKGEEIHELFQFLSKHGLTLGRSAMVYEAMGTGCIRKIKSQPYTLCEVDGIGFKTADSVAKSLGVGIDSAARIREGIHYFFEKEIVGGSGSTGTTLQILLKGASELLEQPMRRIMDVIEALIAEGEFIQTEDDLLFHPASYLAEQKIANNIARLMRHLNNDRGALLSLIEKNEDARNEGVPKDEQRHLSDSQKEALIKVLSASVSVLTGQPGTGKTTILEILLDIMKDHRIGLCAPAGKAAERMERATGLPASTVHRILDVDEDGSFVHHAGNPLELDLLVMDEASMADAYLTAALLSALPRHCKVIFVGDVNQLPSVGAGRVLGDMIDSKVLPVAELTEIRRQGEGSAIVMAARAINSGKRPEFTDEHGDFPLHAVHDSEEGLEQVIELMTNILPSRGIPVDDIQILTPGKAGYCGTLNLNARLQSALNPNAEIEGKYINVFDRRLALGDRVIQTKNNKKRKIYNGDTGKIVGLDIEKGSISVDFTGKGVINIPSDSISKVDLFYAGTIHKSQGSEFPVVVMPVFTDHYRMLKRNLIYTGTTRGRNQVHMVTDNALRALGVAVRTEDTNARITSLKSHLKSALLEWAPKDEKAPEQEEIDGLNSVAMAM